MFRRIIQALCSPVPGHGRDPGMPYADMPPIRLAPVFHAGSRHR